MVVSNSALLPSSLGVRRTGHDQVNFREKYCHCDQPDQHGYAVNLAHHHSVEKLYTVIYIGDSLSSSTKQQEERWGGGWGLRAKRYFSRSPPRTQSSRLRWRPVLSRFFPRVG